MTVADTAHPACPSCQSVNSMITADGTALCFDCTRKWRPGEVSSNGESWQREAVDHHNAQVAANDAIGASLDAEPVSPALHVVDTEPVEAGRITPQDALDSMAGLNVILEGGQHAVIEGIIDAERCLVILDDGRRAEVTLGDIERAIPDPEHVDDVVIHMDDDVAAQFNAAVLATAELIIKAGVATIGGTGADMAIVPPPRGYLPDTDDAMPMVEQAAALAVAMLIRMAMLDCGAIVAAIDNARQEFLG